MSVFRGIKVRTPDLFRGRNSATILHPNIMNFYKLNIEKITCLVFTAVKLLEKLTGPTLYALTQQETEYKI